MDNRPDDFLEDAQPSRLSPVNTIQFPAESSTPAHADPQWPIT